MGNAASISRCRRRARIDRQEAFPSNGIVPPSGYPRSQPPGAGGVDSVGTEGGIQVFPQGHTPRNAPTANPDGAGSFRPVVSPFPHTEAPEHQQASTIRNDVNLRKTTLRLEKDEDNPGFYLVAFSFDTTVPGSISIFFHAKEGPECCLTSLSPHLYEPFRINFDKGLGQKFSQAPGTGVELSLFEESDLLEEGPGEIYPLVVRTETLPIDPPPDALPGRDDRIGAPLPYWVHCQTTHAVLELKDGEYSVRVVKQIIWVDGVRYELQEIFGIENSDGGCGLGDCDSGKECVICLSEPRDTTVLPCRHMCMCSGCAKVLRFQTNRCPICRTPVERLLEIKVPKNEEVIHVEDKAELE